MTNRTAPPSSATSASSASPAAHVVLRRRQAAVQEIVARDLLNDTAPVCTVIDLDTLEELVSALHDAYPKTVPTLHTIAAKSVPLRPVLARFAELGLGCEVASEGELHLALAAGFTPDQLIYDSPAKTRTDINEALRLGVSFNIDNFEELGRVDHALEKWSGAIPRIGVRLNPQSGSGDIEAMSTATETSKFGIGVKDFREELIATFAARPWLRQIHVHSGSQGVSLEHAASNVATIVQLAEAIEAEAGEQRVFTIDVGGGLSVNFDSDTTTPTFHDHARALGEAAPGLYSGKYQLITEFGRSLTAKTGTLLGRVEYLKTAGSSTIAVTHIGVQVAARTVFMPESWPLRVEVYSPDGQHKTGGEMEHTIAGPACFSGDLIATDRLLPEIEAGDIIAVPDTGGYYASNHFSYNSLPRPSIYATRDGDEGRSLLLVRRAQNIDEVVADSGEHKLLPLS